MKIIFAMIAGILLGSGAIFARGADFTWAEAARAAATLGPDFSAKIIRIRSSSRGGKFPSEFCAMIFELDEMLWFYCPLDGTQSLSVERGHAKADWLNLESLLTRIDRELASWEWVAPPSPAATPGEIRNGCFVESVAAFRREFSGISARFHPRLLLYYPKSDSGAGAHTVLIYDEGNATKLIDDSRGKLAQRYPRGMGADGMELARAYTGGGIDHVRWLPLDHELRNRRAEFAAVAGITPQRTPA